MIQIKELENSNKPRDKLAGTELNLARWNE